MTSSPTSPTARVAVRPCLSRRVVVAAAGSALLVLAATACSAGDDDSPRAAVEQYLQALADGDCAAVEAVTTPGFLRAHHGTCADVEAAGEQLVAQQVELRVGEATDSGPTTATVAVAAFDTDSGESMGPSASALVVRQGDRWLVSSLSP